MVSIMDGRLFFLAWFFIGNPLVLLWQCYYVSVAVHPALHPKRAANFITSQFEFGVICALGGFLIFINGYAVYYYLLMPLWRAWRERRFLRLEPIRIPHTLRMSVFVVAMIIAGGMALLVTFGQFVTPFVTPELHWQSTYRHTCNGMDVRIYLDSAESRPADLIKFENIATGEHYTMVMDPNPWTSPEDVPGVSFKDGTEINSWGFADPGNGYSFIVTPDIGDFKRGGSNFVPKWKHIRYSLGIEFGVMMFSVIAVDDSTVNIGTISYGENFTIPSLMLYGDLGLYSKRCVFDPTAEIYSTNETSVGVVKKTPVMRTVQFKICEPLQVCADGGLGDMTAVPVGFLMLQRAKRGIRCCRAERRVPGVEGRSRG